MLREGAERSACAREALRGGGGAGARKHLDESPPAAERTWK